jgi:hypothetical protein
MMQAHNTGKSGRGKVLGKMRKGTVPQLSCSSPQAQHRPACWVADAGMMHVFSPQILTRRVGAWATNFPTEVLRAGGGRAACGRPAAASKPAGSSGQRASGRAWRWRPGRSRGRAWRPGRRWKTRVAPRRKARRLAQLRLDGGGVAQSRIARRAASGRLRLWRWRLRVWKPSARRRLD